MYDKTNYEELALEAGGQIISINPSHSSNINILEMTEPSITEELLVQREHKK